MKIAVIGARGMVGSAVAKEVSERGLEVESITQSGAEGTTVLDFTNTADVAKVVESVDATVISVASRDDYQKAIDAHKALIAAKPSGRLVVVGGAGALEVDGVKLLDLPDFPSEYRPEASALAEVFEAYCNSQGLDWTMIAPSPEIAPGNRTGQYLEGLDSPAGEFVSAEDFAVALVDELLKPKHKGERFTVASANADAAR